ncbi:MAG: ankyrin repeat domain-containing protein [Candidatus Dependentiae bacterium]
MKKYLIILLCLITFSKTHTMDRRASIHDKALAIYGDFFLDLCNGIEEEDTSIIKRSLSKVNPNELIKCKFSPTVKMEASKKYIVLGHPDMITIPNGVKVYIRPIHLCIKDKKLRSLECLLESGARLEVDQELGSSLSLNKESLDYYNRLLAIFTKHKFKINSRDKDGKSLLHFATASANNNLIIALLNYKNIDVNAYDTVGRTPLHYLILGKGQDVQARISCLKTLMASREIDPNKVDIAHRMSPLTMGIISDPDLAKILITYDRVDPNATVMNSYTPLMQAIKSDEAEIVSLILKRDINVLKEDSKGHTAFDYAKDKPELLALLNQHISNTNTGKASFSNSQK